MSFESFQKSWSIHSYSGDCFKFFYSIHFGFVLFQCNYNDNDIININLKINCISFIVNILNYVQLI